MGWFSKSNSWVSVPQTEDFLIEILEWHVNAGDEFSKGDVLYSIYLHTIKENKSINDVGKPVKEKINASFDGVFIKALVSAGEKVRTDSVLAKIYLL